MLRRFSRNYRGLDQWEEEVNAVSRVLVQSDDEAVASGNFTAVRLKVEQNQLVGVSGEIGVLFDALKGA
jgi:hypothetical protein